MFVGSLIWNLIMTSRLKRHPRSWPGKKMQESRVGGLLVCNKRSVKSITIQNISGMMSVSIWETGGSWFYHLQMLIKYILCFFLTFRHTAESLLGACWNESNRPCTTHHGSPVGPGLSQNPVGSTQGEMGPVVVPPLAMHQPAKVHDEQ